MYEYLKGRLVDKNESSCILEVNGAGYLLHVTPFISHGEGEEDVLLYLRTFVKDDGEHTFYGFEDNRERTVFDFLREIKGIGPRTALRVLSRVRWDELCDLVKQENTDVLVMRSRMGEKTIRRILIELKPRLEKLSWESAPERGETIWQETRLALLQLGFSSQEVEKVLRELASKGSEANHTEHLVREALVLMGGKR